MKRVISLLLSLALISFPVLAAEGVAGEVKTQVNAEGKNVMTVRPVEEVFTREQDATVNVMGDSERASMINIRADASKARNGFLKFDVKGLKGAKVEKIELLLTNSQYKTPVELPEGTKTGGNCGFVVIKLDPNSWKQEEITFSTQPLFDEATGKIGEYDPAGQSLKVLETIAVEIDPLFIDKDGLYSFGLFATTGTQDSSFFSTRDKTAGDKYGPQLVITYTGGDSGDIAPYMIGVAALVIIIIGGAIFFIMKKKKSK